MKTQFRQLSRSCIAQLLLKTFKNITLKTQLCDPGVLLHSEAQKKSETEKGQDALRREQWPK